MDKEHTNDAGHDGKKAAQGDYGHALEGGKCPECGGRGYVQKQKGGAVTTCFKCLKEGKLGN